MLRGSFLRLLALASAGLSGCARGAGEGEAHALPLSLLELAPRAELVVLPGAGEPAEVLPPGAAVRGTLEGIAFLDLPLSAASAEVVARFETPEGEFVMRRWDLPIAPAPEILSRAREPQLGGLDLPRMIDPALPLEGGRGVWYVGPDADGRPCLLVAQPAGAHLPEELAVGYAVSAARLARSPLLAGEPARELVRGRRQRGQRTSEALVVPAQTTLELPLPPHGPARLRGLLSAEEAQGTRTLRLAVRGGPTVERVFLGGGGSAPLHLDLEPSSEEKLLTLEVRGPEGSLVYLEEPRLEPLERPAGLPNVCLVIVDTLRADRLERPGLTPSLARLADESLSFEQCWATCSWTLPSVTTLLTSNHGGQHQAWLNDQPLARGIDTLAEVFRRHGYRTAAFTGGVFVDQLYGLDRGFSVFDSSAGGVAAVVGRAREWLAGAGTGPWFLLLHTYEVHAPYRPPDEAWERVLARHPGVLGDRAPEPQAFHDAGGTVESLEQVSALLSELYDEEVRYTDGALGAFFDELRADGALDASVLAFTSDHGEEFGEHGMLGHTDTLYVEQLHVPFLLRLPGAARAGERDARPVSHLDLAPTLLDAAGLGSAVPASFAGRSLLGSGEPSPIYATRNIAEVGILRAMREGSRSLVDGAYIYPRPVSPPELYDLALDPAQREDLAVGGGPVPLAGRLEELADEFDEPKVEAPTLRSSQVMVELRELGYVR